MNTIETIRYEAELAVARHKPKVDTTSPVYQIELKAVERQAAVYAAEA